VGAERWDEQVGSVADEATRLLESLRRSAEDAAAAGPENGGPAEDGAPPHDGGRADSPTLDQAAPFDGAPATEQTTAHDPLCTWCPLCRSAAVLRSLSPETLVRLADLAGVAATVLADLASARTRTAAQTQATEDAAPPRDAAAGPGATAHPIPIVDADDPQEAPRG
jgi:hypothetical protein